MESLCATASLARQFVQGSGYMSESGSWWMRHLLPPCWLGTLLRCATCHSGRPSASTAGHVQVVCRRSATRPNYSNFDKFVNPLRLLRIMRTVLARTRRATANGANGANSLQILRCTLRIMPTVRRCMHQKTMGYPAHNAHRSPRVCRVYLMLFRHYHCDQFLRIMPTTGMQ